MHLNGLSTQHGKSHSVVASQGTSRASSPGPDSEQTNTEAISVTDGTDTLVAAASKVPLQDGSTGVAATSLSS